MTEKAMELNAADWRWCYDRMTEWFPDMADWYKQVIIKAIENKGPEEVKKLGLEATKEIEQNETRDVNKVLGVSQETQEENE